MDVISDSTDTSETCVNRTISSDLYIIKSSLLLEAESLVSIFPLGGVHVAQGPLV